MQRYKEQQAPRPRTMLDNRFTTSYQTLAPPYQTYCIAQKTTAQKQSNCVSLSKNPQYNPSLVCLTIPKFQVEYESCGPRLNMHSRQQMQLMNKKLREIRTSRATPIQGLYDIQNDRRLLTARTASALNNYEYVDSLLNTQIKVQVQSLKKLEKYQKVITRSVKKQQTVDGKLFDGEYQQGVLKSKTKVGGKRYLQRSKSSNKRKYQLQNNQIVAQPELHSESGYVLSKFESKLKKKSMEDNLHVMATLLKRKIKVLDKKDVMVYLSKLMNRHN